MRTLHALAPLLVLSGCAAPRLPEEAKLSLPAPCPYRAALPDTPHLVDTKQHPMPDLTPERFADLEAFLHVALPAEAWSALSGFEYYGDVLSVAQTPAAHERIDELLEHVRRAGLRRMHLLARWYEVSWQVVSDLGPLRTAKGHGDDSPFLSVPLSTSAAAHLEALADDGQAKRLGSTRRTGAPTQWVSIRSSRDTHYTAGLEYHSTPRVEVLTSPTVAVANSVKVVEAASLTLAGGATLLAFRVEDTIVRWSPELKATAGVGTDVPTRLPERVARRCEDAVVLREGESLALIASAEVAGARLLVLTPFEGSYWPNHPWSRARSK